jgi:hypothetical protein
MVAATMHAQAFPVDRSFMKLIFIFVFKIESILPVQTVLSHILQSLTEPDKLLSKHLKDVSSILFVTNRFY